MNELLVDLLTLEQHLGQSFYRRYVCTNGEYKKYQSFYLR